MPSTQSVLNLRQPVNNMVRNWNFESVPPFTAAQTTRGTWIDGTLSGSTSNNAGRWALGGPVGSVSAQYDTTTFHTGSASLKISNLDTVGRSRALQVNALDYSSITRLQAGQSLIPVTPSTSYTLSAWVKTNNAASNSAYITIVEFTGDGAQGTSTSSSTLSGTNTWTQLTVTRTVASTARFIGIILANDVAGNVSDVWFDDLRFDLTSGTTRQTAGTRRTAVTPSITSTLYFNGDGSLQNIIPINVAALHIGSSSSYSFGARVYLYPKTLPTSIDDQCLANCDLNYGTNTGYAFYVTASSGALQAVIGNIFYTSPAGLFSYGTWHYVIFTLGSTTLKGYVDGVLVWVQTVQRVATGSAGNEGFMREFGDVTSGRNIFGYVQDLFSSLRIISQPDVNNIVNNGTYPTVDIRYKFNEGVGGALVDYSGNGNSGVVGTPFWTGSGRRLI